MSSTAAAPGRTAPTARPTTVQVYDTTLRDGAQQEGMNLSVADKLAIAALLDELGVGYIEGGWPGAIPKDTEFFARAAKELDLRHARLAAFGATCKPGAVPADDAQVRALVESEAPVVTLVAKSDVRHVERALRTTPEENLRMIGDTVRHLVGLGRGSWSTPSTSSTATASTPTTPCGASARPSRRGPRPSCCATPTAGCCRTGSPRRRALPPRGRYCGSGCRWTSA